MRNVRRRRVDLMANAAHVGRMDDYTWINVAGLRESPSKGPFITQLTLLSMGFLIRSKEWLWKYSLEYVNKQALSGCPILNFVSFKRRLQRHEKKSTEQERIAWF